jgi:hypothetical protein
VAAATVLTIVPTIILFSLVQNRLVEGLKAGAVREESDVSQKRDFRQISDDGSVECHHAGDSQEWEYP